MNSSVTFPASPSTSSTDVQTTHLRPPHLPFRRISLPTAPSPMQRESVVSVASFGSLAEEDDAGTSSHAVPMPIKGKGRERPEISTSISPTRRSRLLSGESSHPSSPLSQRFGSPTSYQVSPRKRERLRSTGAKAQQDDAREGKRRKVIQEFLDTEKAYVAGLDLIYEHFLLPLLSSLDTGNPILDRAELTSIFSNFIDIWNFHRSFLAELEATIGSALSEASPTTPGQTTPLPPLSPVLLAHFPYLSLYTLFITSFASTIDTLISLTTPPSSSHFPSFSPTTSTPSYNATFATFLQTQESHPKCQRLHLRDWLLTIVQRCPRYLLLLKDLRSCTDTKSEECVGLGRALGVVGRITTSLNTSLQTHHTTLTLLTLQRHTSNLPFPLVAPSRTFLKRGRLTIQESESGSRAREREVLLFNDALVWLGKEGEWWGDLHRPHLLRGRSKSEAELATVANTSHSRPSTPKKGGYRRSYHPPSPASPTFAVGAEDEKWVCKGHVGLIDLEVVLVGIREHAGGEGEEGDEEEEDWDGEEPRVELLSPEGSWVLYGLKEELLEWTQALRNTKSMLLSSLGTTGHTTLTSSAATRHVRRSLMALPFKPGDARVAATIRAKPSSRTAATTGTIRGISTSSRLVAVPELKGKGKHSEVQRRSKVEHFVPAVWVPDEKTPACMRCGRGFGWRRRRHHCRLCGRCVCSACSDRTFYISDKSKDTGGGAKAARACDSCYDAVFPVVQPSASSTISLKHPPLPRPTEGAMGNDTITSIAQVDKWFSVPSGKPSASASVEPKALMTFDFEIEGLGRRKPQKRRSFMHAAHEGIPDEGNDIEEDDVFDEDVSLTPLPQRKEDTVRRRKRFSRPAVSVQNTSVTARTAEVEGAGGGVGGGVWMLPKRFSLVLGRGVEREREVGRGDEGAGSGSGVRESVVVGRLQELLGRGK
ncbi:hypothetical protein BDQ17DRAFT_1401664 [Cyathus striatus]|nr:hypothetical protein BDQ17DRAFT_1401664 [Cyathus striatus]